MLFAFVNVTVTVVIIISYVIPSSSVSQTVPWTIYRFSDNVVGRFFKDVFLIL